ncbi:phospholipase D [Cavenderia fasciculata]|uniref:phospholipase D n=1 Tax=Cavenderia fasciculata TaxID=261658 RepID=F4QE74_CACFS|nr:phospholipase D [Cavenderia fasciculata]EGG14021.1 phospholipase D [Cavenderia fasciculata]|eukprot:XP_004350729.1 phospholipase D [Cavenderia fasciculata]
MEIEKLAAAAHFSTQNKPRNVFLDISNENQPSRRYFVGRFSTSSTKSCESIVHISKTPITVHLSYGPLMYHDLGPQTIYEFLYEDPVHLGKKKFLTFGRRGPLYHVCYSVSLVKYSYGFSLNKISCLKQITTQKDQLFAEVEFNHSPQSIGLGHTNRYHLGNFQSHDMTEIHSVHNLTFSTLGNFVITFYVKTPIAEYILGTMKYTPTHEISNNPAILQGLSAFTSSTTSPIMPPPLAQTHPTNPSSSSSVPSSEYLANDRTLNMSNEMYNSGNHNSNNVLNNVQQQQQQQQQQQHQQQQQQQQQIILNKERGGLLFNRTNDDKIYTFLMDDFSTTKKITLTSPEGKGSYEFVFTLTKTDYMLTGESNNQRLDGEEIDSSPLLTIHTKDNPNTAPTRRYLPVVDKDKNIPTNATSNSASSNNNNNNNNNSGQEEINNTSFSIQTEGNDVEILIDGLQTFRRYFEVMMAAKHSINILAWELSFSFGLVMTERVKSGIPTFSGGSTESLGKWITLEDVLLSRALDGVSVRIIVWRHELLSHLTRFLYLGEVTIEREAAKLERRCKRLGIPCRILNTTHHNLNDIYEDELHPPQYQYPTPQQQQKQQQHLKPIGHITIIIAGNPEGILSSHHEKLVLIDSECPENCVALTGGFDMARGRYDQPLHQIPKQIRYLPTTKDEKLGNSTSSSSNSSNSSPTNNLNRPIRYTGTNIQPVLPQIRFLWHDIQILLRGPSTQQLRLHFIQRWVHAFTNNISLTRSKSLIKDVQLEQNFHCQKAHLKNNEIQVTHTDPAPIYRDCSVRLFRNWKGVLDSNLLFDDFGKMILNAKEFLYIEHQYPFQNFTLTYYMCEALKAKPNLHILIVTPVKTDLPSGLVGELFDWSQDHIIRHLHLIYSVAPDRVGVYGLIRQDEETKRIKPIYIHSKLIVVDDVTLNVGSTNMDNMSFFHSSELSISVMDPALARETRVRLAQEHLGDHYNESMVTNFMEMFHCFKRVSDENYERLRHKRLLIGRPIALNPLDKMDKQGCK